MKSIINSEQVKKLVFEIVEKTLEECAFQHDVAGQPYEGFDSKNLNEEGLPTSLGLVTPPEWSIKFANTQPVKLKLTFEFYLEGSERSNLFCQPVIDLTDAKIGN
jgi:hypothetical protein